MTVDSFTRDHILNTMHNVMHESVNTGDSKTLHVEPDSLACFLVEYAIRGYIDTKLRYQDSINPKQLMSETASSKLHGSEFQQQTLDSVDNWLATISKDTTTIVKTMIDRIALTLHEQTINTVTTNNQLKKDELS